MKKFYHLPFTIYHFDEGQALVTLLFFMIVAITITAAAVAVTLINSVSTSQFDQGNNAYAIAEAGAENALVRLLRDPTYVGIGDTLAIDQGIATIQISGSSPIVITSLGKVANSLRKIQVQASFTNNILSIISWKEVL